MTTITDDAPEYKQSTKKTRGKEPKPIATSVLNVNIVPNKTRHYNQLESAGPADKKVAARKLNLVSEQNFIKEYAAKGIEVYTGLEDPLDDKEKGILHDNFRREGAVRRATVLKAQFILGERTKIVLDTNRVYATQEREDEELEKLNNNPDYLNVLEDMMNIDEDVNLYQMLKDILIAGENYGRAVLVKQYDTDGIPTRLIPLWSVRLGKVYVNAETHELLGVEYLDYEGEERILRAEDIIYFTVDDYPITPNSRWYGLPPNEVSMATALSNRITMETAVNEIVTRHWAPMRIIKAPGIQGQTRLDDFSKKLMPGKDVVTNQENISVETINMDVDVNNILKSVEEREKKIFRDLTVPLVIGFQDETNRATAISALNQWTESTIKDKRTQLKNVIEEQWYQPTLRMLLERRAKRLSQEPNVPLEIQQPDNLGIEQTEPPIVSDGLPPDVGIPPPQDSVSHVPAPIDPMNPPFRFKMSYDPILFDTFLDTAAAVLGYKDANVIDEEVAMEVGGFSEEHIDHMREKWNEKNALAQPAIQPQTQPTIDNGNGQQDARPGVPNLPIAARSAGSKIKKEKPKKNGQG